MITPGPGPFPTFAFLGRCKGCKGIVRVMVEQVEKTRVSLGYGRTEARIRYRLPNGAIETDHGGMGRIFGSCLCGSHVEFRRIRGTLSEKPCGAACRNAKGPACDCACAGKNHGAGFSVSCSSG